MKTIKKDELFRNFSDFLNTKGVALREGVYARRINRACDLLTDAINSTQKTVRHAKGEVDRKLDQLRQKIHEVTAPAPPPPAPEKKTPKHSAPAKPKTSAPSRKSARRK